MTTKSVIVWAVLAVWAIASVFIGQTLSDSRQYRINNFDVLPGVGTMQRATEGEFYHVRPDGSAREIYPRVAPAYLDACFECRIVREGTLAATDDFCAVGSRSTLPELEFQVPCETGTTLDNGPKVMAAVVFFTPIVLWMILMGVKRGIFKPREIDHRRARNKFDR